MMTRVPFLGQVRLMARPAHGRSLGQYASIIPELTQEAQEAYQQYQAQQVAPAPATCPIDPSGTVVCPPPPVPATAPTEEKKAIAELTETLKAIQAQQAKGQQVPPEFWEMMKQQQALVAQAAAANQQKEFPWKTVGIVGGVLGAGALIYALASKKI